LTQGDQLGLGEHTDGRKYVWSAVAPQPLIGPTGFDLETRFLPEAGLVREQVSMHNVLKCRWAKNGRRTNELPGGKVLSQAVAHCMGAHYQLPPTVDLVIAMGGVSWKALGGPGTVTDWRGFLKP
jgi:uracil-DNA glycosylase